MTKNDQTPPERTNDRDRRILRTLKATYRGMDPAIGRSDLNAVLNGGTVVSGQATLARPEQADKAL
jgi:hypothetical protein